MLAVVVLTATVLIVAVNIYLQIARSSADAAAQTRRERRSVLVLDRLARDLEGALLLTRPDDVDPLAWPWLFLADSRGGGEGADQLKLDTRSFRSTRSDAEAGDVSVVAWWIAPRDDEGFELLRWSSPTLPEGLERELPRRDDPGVRVVADDVAHFSLRLLDEGGAWHERWDSSTLAQSNQLPLGAEIALALLPADPGLALEELPRHTRRVRLPLRPLDLAALSEGAGGTGAGSGEEDEEGEEGEEDEVAGEDEAGECVTVAQCRQRNPEAFRLFLASTPNPAAMEQVIQSLANQCFAEQAAPLGIQVEGCQ